METATLYVSTMLDASPERIYETLTTSSLHEAFTGAPAELDSVEGGRFSYFGGAVHGTYVSLEPSCAINQRLRAATWPEGYEADVLTELVPRDGGARTLVRVRESGAPPEALDDVANGWSDYWSALAGYLADRKRDVVRRFVEEYKNRHNPDIVDDLVAENCRVHIPFPGLPEGREGMRVNGRMMCGAFPDVHVEREFFVTEGDLVVERAVAEATHEGPLAGIEPSGAGVTWTELHAYRVRDGQIVEIWSEADFMGIMVQIGAVPALGGPAAG